MIRQIGFIGEGYEQSKDFLKPIMENYLEIIREVGISIFAVQARRLVKALRQKFGWNLERGLSGTGLPPGIPEDAVLVDENGETISLDSLKLEPS